MGFRFIRTLAVALGITALAAPLTAAQAAPGDWAQLGGGAGHSSYQKSESALTTSSVRHLRAAWQNDLGGPVYTGTPAVVGNVAYVGAGTQTDAGSIVAVNTRSGRVLWQRALDGASAGDVSPAVSNGTVYIATDRTHGADGSLWALDAATGNVVWTAHDISWHVSAPVVKDGLVVVSMSTIPLQVHAYDAATGALRWQATAPMQEDPPATPAIAGGRVYVYDGTVTALDEQTGATVWSTPNIGPFTYKAALAVQGDTVYATARNGLHALDAATGAPRWTYGANWWYARSPALNWGAAYLQTATGSTVRLLAINPGDGSLIWARKVIVPTHAYDVVAGSAAVANGVVHVSAATSTGYGLYSYRASDGRLLHVTPLPSAGRTFGGPVVAHGSVYDATESGVLSALRVP